MQFYAHCTHSQSDKLKLKLKSMNKCFKIPNKIKTKNDAKPKNSYMKVASSWSKNVLLQKIFEKVRTQRNLVRTQRELVYKHKCALNENALNEVRTQRGFAV